MRRLLTLAILPCALTCHAVPPAPAGRAAIGPAHRVVLLSLDGFAASRHRALLAAGAYRDADGVAALERGGYVVERAIPVNPTLTAVSHIAIATGAFPSSTGIVSNRFHVPGTAILEGISGFDAPIGAKTLWQAFRRQGKRVGVLTFPGCDGTGEARRADFGMVYVNASFSRPEVVTLGTADFSPATMTLPPGVVSYSPPRTTTLTVALRGEGLPASVSFRLTTLDTTNDGIANYDTLLADEGDSTGGSMARVHQGEWFPITFTAPHTDGGRRIVGAWCLLQALSPDLKEVRIYRGGFHATQGYPRAFREQLDRQAGFWPGAPDERALDQGEHGLPGLALSEFMAQVRRFSEFFNACSRVALTSERFDLLMAYQPIPDEVEHQLLLADPNQTAYSKELSATCLAAVDDAYRIADHAVGELARQIDLARDALVVVSDHGMAPLWELVHVNEVLRRAGLAEAQEINGRPAVGPGSKVVAFSSGGCAHLYLNLQGREPGGMVPPAEADATVRAAARALAVIEVAGKPAVEAMFRKDELGSVGLASPNSGDLVVFFAPGFAGDDRIGGPPTEPSPYYGQHGYLNRHPEIAAVWFARGAGVPHRRVRRASLTEVAPFVSRLAGVAPPAQAAAR